MVVPWSGIGRYVTQRNAGLCRDGDDAVETGRDTERDPCVEVNGSGGDQVRWLRNGVSWYVNRTK